MSTIIVRNQKTEINPLPFSPLPHALLHDRRLTGTAVKLAGVLLSYCRDKSKCFPSVNTLAEDLGMSRRTIQLSLKQLKSTGWINEEWSHNETHRVFVMNWRLPGGAINCAANDVQGAQILTMKRGEGAQPAAPEREPVSKKKDFSPTLEEIRADCLERIATLEPGNYFRIRAEQRLKELGAQA